jgi:hypothetical protein
MCTYLNPQLICIYFGQWHSCFWSNICHISPADGSDSLSYYHRNFGCVVTKFGFKFIPSVNPVSTPVTSKAYSDYLIKIIEYFIEVHFLILDWNEQAAVRKNFANVGKRLLTCFNA